MVTQNNRVVGHYEDVSRDYLSEIYTMSAALKYQTHSLQMNHYRSNSSANSTVVDRMFEVKLPPLVYDANMTKKAFNLEDSSKMRGKHAGFRFTNELGWKGHLLIKPYVWNEMLGIE